MAFWGNLDAQPKRQHRFTMTFGKKGGQNQLPAWIVSSVTRPSMDISTVEHQYLNHTFKFPGRAKWNDISVTLKDPLKPDAGQELYKILSEAGYKPPTGGPQSPNIKETFTKSSFAATLGSITIESLDAKGATVETWVLFNPLIVNVNWGTFDYASEELVEITLDIAYDFAQIEQLT
tara:strand:- start:1808 stop:2338 length:531 start_codon:yes stop_codon:yes gene_type:complete